jgi:putative pyruvate formate lyase activating enzyme
VKNAERIVSYVYNTYGDSVFLSLMSQYTPFADTEEKYPEIGRKITKRSYERLVNFALGLGVKNAYIQEGGTAKESFIPRFDGQGVQKCGTIPVEN